jgi:hypothetical protein
MTNISIGLSENSKGQVGKGKPSPITAILLPSILQVHDGLTLSDTLDSTVKENSNYVSKEGAISTVIAEWSVDGGVWTPLGTATVTYDQRIQARVTVTDDQGNERVFLTGETVVSGIKPTLESSCSLTGCDLTISVDSLSGTPTPSTALTLLTLDGGDVLGDATGSGPWSYTVPDSAVPQTVDWIVTATNAEGSATANGSVQVAASLFPPAASGTLTDLTLTVGEAMTPVDVAADFDLGTPAATIAPQSGPLPDGLFFDGMMLSGTPTSVTTAVTLVFRATNLVGYADTAFQVTVAEAPEIIVTPPALAALTHGETVSGAVTWGVATPPAGETLNAPVREMSLDDGVSWTLHDGDHVATFGETILVRETWSTLEGTGPAYGTSAAQGVAGLAPAVLTAPGLSDLTPAPGETVTVTEGAYSGTPAPKVTGTLSLGGKDVTAEMVGLDYTIPVETADGTTLVWSETAGNGVAPNVTQTASAMVKEAGTVVMPTEIVVLGASLVHESFGNAYDSATQTWGKPNGTVTSALQTAAGLKTAIPVYGYGIPGARLEYRSDYDIPSAADRIDIVRATFPNALIVVHMGGGNVTLYRPYSSIKASEKTTWQTEMGALAAKAAADDKVLVGSLTFRDYGGTTFLDPDNGSRPFNEVDDPDFTGIVPALAGTASLTSHGRPFFDFYRWMLLDFENRLDTDNVHLNAQGEADMRAYVVETLATILGGGEPAEIPERGAAVYTLEVSDPGDGTLEITYDGGEDTTLDSITLTDTAADPYWEGTHTTYADGTPLEIGQLSIVAAKCLVAPPISVTTDADGSGTPSVGDTVSIPDVGVWLYEGDTEPTYAVAWYDAGGEIPGATGIFHVLAEGQAGEAVYPVITAGVSGKTDESQSCTALTVDSDSDTDPWAFSGSTVTNIPASEGWTFSGSTVTTIPSGV